MAGLNLLFYLTLSLMLETLFESAGPVIAIPLAFAFGQQLLGGLPIIEYLPWSLLVPVAGSDSSVIGTIIGGQPIQAYGALVFTVTACVLFTIVAFWQFERTEL